MTFREKFRLYNIILLITPIFFIGVVSVIFLILFALRFPVEELYPSQASLINPLIFIKAVGAFFNKNPLAVGYVAIYILICIAICATTNTLITSRLVKTIEKPIKELRENVDTIRSGNYSFEVMGSEYDEINDLCEGVDRMRHALLAAREYESHLKKERNMLIANISHDLKTPITSIKGYIDGINDGIADTPEKLSKYLDTIRKKADLIDELVTNLSTYAKLEVSGLTFNLDVGDLRDLILDICDGYRIDTEQNNIDFNINICGEPLTVMIDGEKMRRVFINIIDNAIKYRCSSGSKIDIKCFKEENFAYVTIIDNGTGINPNELEKVFESFYRTDSSRTSQIKGNGLGLSIARQIVQKHKGRLWLKSDGEGKGTVATVCIPIHGGINAIDL